MSAAREAVAVADDRLALEDPDRDRLDACRGGVARVLRHRFAEGRVRDHERSDELGAEHPLGLAEVRRHASGKPGARLGHFGIEQFRAQGGVQDLRRVIAQERPARGVELTEGGAGLLGQAGDRRLEQRQPILGREVRLERGVDPADPVLEERLLFGRDRDRLVGRVVVLERDGGAGRLARLRGQDRALEIDGLRRDDVTWRELAGLDLERLLRQQVGAEDRGHRHDEDPRGDAETRRVTSGEAGERRRSVGQHGSGVRGSGCRSVGPAVVDGEIRLREGLGDESADDLAVGAAAGARREPAHDLAQVAGIRGAGRGDRLVDERRDLGLVEGGGQVFGRGSRSRRFPCRRDRSRPAFVYASTNSRRVLTSRVSTARNSSSVSGFWLRFSTLYAALVAIRRTSRRSESPPRMATAISVWSRSRRDTGVGYLGRSFMDARGAAVVTSGRGPAQPACVRAFFLRLASLRLRLTEGFS